MFDGSVQRGVAEAVESLGWTSASAATRCGTRSRPICSSPAPIIRTVQQLLGHADVSTTMIDTHVLQCGTAASSALLDQIGTPSR